MCRYQSSATSSKAEQAKSPVTQSSASLQQWMASCQIEPQNALSRTIQSCNSTVYEHIQPMMHAADLQMQNSSSPVCASSLLSAASVRPCAREPWHPPCFQAPLPCWVTPVRDPVGQQQQRGQMALMWERHAWRSSFLLQVPSAFPASHRRPCLPVSVWPAEPVPSSVVSHARLIAMIGSQPSVQKQHPGVTDRTAHTLKNLHVFKLTFRTRPALACAWKSDIYSTRLQVLADQQECDDKGLWSTQMTFSTISSCQQRPLTLRRFFSSI